MFTGCGVDEGGNVDVGGEIRGSGDVDCGE